MSKSKLGIIGFGDFSKLLVRYLHPYFDIVVATRQKDLSTDLPFAFVSQKEALAQPIIIPSMPAQYLRDFFTQNAKHIKPGTLVVDVCSVKVNSVKALTETLPEDVDILATHPLFGPASAANGLTGKQIMLYPVRLPAERFEKIKLFLHDTFKLKIIECTPEEHDKALAYVQGLSHYIGRVMQLMNVPETKLMTSSYEDLLDMKRIQGGDSWELFESIMKENPYALEVHDKFEKACIELDKQLGL